FQELIVQYNSDKSRYFYGKKTFGLLKSELQKVLKSNTNLLRESPFIENAGLVEFICKQNPIAA
ncbi:MAG: hypothetical protein J6S68_11085, partial [Acinetobacter sp.]|nr:hypothetical protein [Acinetobacter sp.]